MEGKASVFHTGKIILAGGKSELGARKSIRRVKQILRELGFGVSKRTPFDVRNIVIVIDTASTVNLEALSLGIEGVVYEPGQFPGSIIRLHEYGVTALVFGSGKVIVAGIKSESVIESVTSHVLSKISAFTECRS